MDDKTKNWCLHVDTQKWFESAGENDPWIIVYKSGNIYVHNEEDRFVWSFLIKNQSIEEELENYTFNHFDGYPVTDKLEKEDGSVVYYSRFGNDDREPLFFSREFTGKKGYLELSQEFIHFFQLFYDQPRSRYLLITPDGGEETVVQVKDNQEILILVRRLRQFLAFKNMSLILGVVIRRLFNEPIGGEYHPTNTKQVLVKHENNLHYAIWYQDGYGGSQYFTELIGKKVIYPMPLEKTGIYPFETTKFENFIIGQDENGNPIEYSCNPKELSDYFGNNVGKPHFLTPVFFKKDVLIKYYNSPEKYKVEDGDIRIGDYILRADTNNSQFVVVFLGDLGRDIPFSEQTYWKSFNVFPSGKMSDTALRRDFLGQWADPEAEQFIFKNKYEELLNNWKKKFGWPLFKTLNEGDLYRLDNIRIPLSENQQEFDQQTESLVILIIDSINKAQIDKNLNIVF